MEDKYYIDSVRIDNPEEDLEIIYAINNSHSITNGDIALGLHLSEKLGVLSKYVDKMYTREEINEVISYLISHNPYIGNPNTELSIYINRFVTREDDCIIGSLYHNLTFKRLSLLDIIDRDYDSVSYQFLDPKEMVSALYNSIYNQ